jgi:hypothetical protein
MSMVQTTRNTEEESASGLSYIQLAQKAGQNVVPLKMMGLNKGLNINDDIDSPGKNLLTNFQDPLINQYIFKLSEKISEMK